MSAQAEADAEKRKKEYLEKQGVKCLFCGSTYLQGGSITMDAGLVEQRVGCGDCNSSWYDIYTLYDVEEVDNGLQK